jgi:tetratricopeptide (TPR) repeat protein
MQLGALLPRQTLELVRCRIDGLPTPLLCSIIHTMTRGNPFYAGELIDALARDEKLVQQPDRTWQVSAELLARLQAAGFVHQIEGEWDLKPEVDLSKVQLGIPDSIHGLVLSQVDRLPEDHKLTLKVCSVIGHHFSIDLLSQVRPTHKDLARVQREIDLLEAERIVRQENPALRTYAFSHHTTQEVVYTTLLHAQRRHLHGVVARNLSGQQPTAVTQIAHHAYLGEAWSLAMQYNLLAAQRAQQVYANQQSLDFYQNALRSAEELPQTDTVSQRHDIHLALGELLVSTGQYEAAYVQLEEAISLAQVLGKHASEARACRWFGRAHELRGEYDPALEWLDKGFNLLAHEKSTEEAELALIAGLIKSRQGDYKQALAFCQRSLGVAAQLDDASVRARTFNLMGIIDRRRGRSDTALRRFQQSLDEYEQLGDVYGQATSHNLVANGHFMRAQWNEADHHYRQSLEMFAQIGDSYHQVLVSNNLGGIALKQGRLDQALDHYERAINLLEQTGGSLWVIGALHMNLGNTLVQRRELDKAVQQLQMAHDRFEQASVRDLLPELFGLFAEAALLQGNTQEAEKMGRRAVDLARELEMPCEEGHNLRILGQIAQADQRFAQAEQHYVDSYAVLQEVKDPYECAKTQLSLAELYAMLGQTGYAEKALDTCEQAFRLLDASLDLDKASSVRAMLRIGEP